MEAGEPVYAVSAFPDTAKTVAIGCESGKLIVKDVDSESDVYSCQNTDSVIIVRTVNANTLYAATEEQIFFFDIRESHAQKVVAKAPSEIYDFAIENDVIAIATLSNDILLTDKRVLRKAKAPGILPSVCSSLVFNNGRIIAGYMDSVVGEWQLKSGKFEAFESVKVEQMNPAVVHSVDSLGDFTVAGRQTSLSIYKNGKLVGNDLYEHEAPVQAVCMARCFGRPFSASGAADGTMMVFDLEKLEPYDCMTCDKEKIQCITSNSEFIAIADTSDNGTIGVFTANDFEKQ